MENRVSFIVIGIFVFVLSLSAVGFVLWLGKYAQSGEYGFYKVVTGESVSGLNLNAPVKFRGVSVGEVKEIYIDEQNSEQVIVLIKVKEGTPIKQDTYALIEPQGITGLSYIQLEGGSNESDLLETGWLRQDYPSIPSEPSMFARVDETLQKIGDQTQSVLGRAQDVMSDENLQNLERILENLVLATQTLNENLQMIKSKEEQIDLLLSRAVHFENSATEAAQKVKEMSQNVSNAINYTGIDTMNSMRKASDTVFKVMGNLDQKIQEGTFDVDVLLRESLLPLQAVLEDLRGLILQTKEGVRQLSESPSDILYKSAQVPLAPKEQVKK